VGGEAVIPGANHSFLYVYRVCTAALNVNLSVSVFRLSYVQINWSPLEPVSTGSFFHFLNRMKFRYLKNQIDIYQEEKCFTSKELFSTVSAQ
jgi:hypothetical protein